MSFDSFFSELTFQEWFLVGIVTYVFLVILIVFLRYCALKRIFCPFSRCGLHCIYMGRFCTCDVCPKCGSGKISGSPFCCQRKHTIYNNPCLFLPIPTYSLKCFVPNCRYFYCVCCECTQDEKEAKKISRTEPMKSLEEATESVLG